MAQRAGAYSHKTDGRCGLLGGRKRQCNSVENLEMRKFRLTKWGQLQPLSESEMDQAFSKDERWTVRPIFVVFAVILCAGAVIYDMFRTH
jgi:hypothetical protein